MKEKLQPAWLTGTVGALLTVLVGLGLRFIYLGEEVPLGQGLIHWSYDLPFIFRPTLQPDEAVVVYLDDESHRELQQPHDQRWDRSLHARLLDRLKEDQAKIVVLDILFDEPSTNALADDAFAKAIRRHGLVVLGGEHVQSEHLGTPIFTTIPPMKLFREAATWGIVQLQVDPDYAIRQHFNGAMESGEFVPGLAWKTAEMAGAGAAKLSPNAMRERWLNYYGPPGTLRNVSYRQALRGDGVPPGFFRGKIVFVGALQSTDFTGKGKDEFRSPYSWWTRRFSPGVEVHATVFLNLLRQDWLTRVPAVGELIIFMIAGGVIGFGLPRLRVWLSLLGAAISLALLAVLAWLLFRYELVWFAWLIVLVQVVVALSWAILVNAIRDYIEARVLERSLTFHLSPRRAKQVLKRPELLRPYAEKQEVSILFSDIANFSTISDRTLPDKLFQQLNRCFQETISCVHQTDGTVIKLIGDAIFAIWNAPELQRNHQELACQAALLLRDKLVEFDAANEILPLRTRVGLHTGLACVGNCGSSERFDYTAIGANVNLASRLESLNKHLGTEILASDSMIEPVASTFVVRSAGHFRLKGSDRVLEVFELVGSGRCAEGTRPWREAFAEGLRKFQRAEFVEAQAAFEQTLQLHPADGPAKFYLGLARDYQSKPPPKGWFGEVNMDEK